MRKCLPARAAKSHGRLRYPFPVSRGRELPAVPDGHEAVEASWIPLTVLRDPSRHLLLPVPAIRPKPSFPAWR